MGVSSPDCRYLNAARTSHQSYDVRTGHEVLPSVTYPPFNSTIHILFRLPAIVFPTSLMFIFRLNMKIHGMVDVDVCQHDPPPPPLLLHVTLMSPGRYQL